MRFPKMWYVPAAKPQISLASGVNGLCYIRFYLIIISENLVFTSTCSKKYVKHKTYKPLSKSNNYSKIYRGILKLEGTCNTRLSDFDGLFSIIDIGKRSKRSLYA